MASPLARALHGRGPSRVVVLHDWMGDRRNYDPMLPYLDGERFTYAFVDLRGYGGSRHLGGAFTAAEASADLLALADDLGWARFAAVGHSMSGLVVQRLAADAPARVTAVAAITPVGPGGLRMPPEVLAALERIALRPEERRPALAQALGDRLGPRWVDWKLARWDECSDPAAVHGWLRMFATTDLRDRTEALHVPLLAVAGEHDALHFSEEALRAAFSSHARAQVVLCRNAGHYPMQETPPFLAATLERFLSAP